MLLSSQRRLSRQKTLKLLEELETSSSPVSSLCLPPRLPLSEVEQMLAAALDLRDIPPDLSQLISRSATGAVLFYTVMPEYGPEDVLREGNTQYRHVVGK